MAWGWPTWSSCASATLAGRGSGDGARRAGGRGGRGAARAGRRGARDPPPRGAALRGQRFQPGSAGRRTGCARISRRRTSSASASPRRRPRWWSRRRSSRRSGRARRAPAEAGVQSEASALGVLLRRSTTSMTAPTLCARRHRRRPRAHHRSLRDHRRRARLAGRGGRARQPHPDPRRAARSRARHGHRASIR